MPQPAQIRRLHTCMMNFVSERIVIVGGILSHTYVYMQWVETTTSCASCCLSDV